MKACAHCGTKRIATDLARLFRGGSITYLCHGFMDDSPTCYELRMRMVDHPAGGRLLVDPESGDSVLDAPGAT